MTTERFRDFDEFEAEHKQEPLIFKLGGQEWHASHLGFIQLISLTRRMAAGGAEVALGFDDFLTGVLPEEEREAFRAMLEREDVSLPTFVHLGNWIVEVASSIPFDEPSGSLPLRRKAGGRSRVVSLSKGSDTLNSGGSASAAG
jgi:hypothetical protein